MDKGHVHLGQHQGSLQLQQQQQHRPSSSLPLIPRQVFQHAPNQQPPNLHPMLREGPHAQQNRESWSLQQQQQQQQQQLQPQQQWGMPWQHQAQQQPAYVPVSNVNNGGVWPTQQQQWQQLDTQQLQQLRIQTGSLDVSAAAVGQTRPTQGTWQHQQHHRQRQVQQHEQQQANYQQQQLRQGAHFHLCQQQWQLEQQVQGGQWSTAAIEGQALPAQNVWQQQQHQFAHLNTMRHTRPAAPAMQGFLYELPDETGKQAPVPAAPSAIQPPPCQTDPQPQPSCQPQLQQHTSIGSVHGSAYHHVLQQQQQQQQLQPDNSDQRCLGQLQPLSKTNSSQQQQQRQISTSQLQQHQQQQHYQINTARQQQHLQPASTAISTLSHPLQLTSPQLFSHSITSACDQPVHASSNSAASSSSTTLVTNPTHTTNLAHPTKNLPIKDSTNPMAPSHTTRLSCASLPPQNPANTNQPSATTIAQQQANIVHQRQPQVDGAHQKQHHHHQQQQQQELHTHKAQQSQHRHHQHQLQRQRQQQEFHTHTAQQSQHRHHQHQLQLQRQQQRRQLLTNITHQNCHQYQQQQLQELHTNTTHQNQLHHHHHHCQEQQQQCHTNTAHQTRHQNNNHQQQQQQQQKQLHSNTAHHDDHQQQQQQLPTSSPAHPRPAISALASLAFTPPAKKARTESPAQKLLGFGATGSMQAQLPDTMQAQPLPAGLCATASLWAGVAPTSTGGADTSKLAEVKPGVVAEPVATITACPLPQQQQQQQQQQQKRVHEYHGRCPYSCCPGIYEACGRSLRWVRLGFWGCERWPECDFRYWPPVAVPYPQLSLDIVSSSNFKVVAYPGAEHAVDDAGGVEEVMLNTGLNIRSLRSLAEAKGRRARHQQQQEHQQQQHHHQQQQQQQQQQWQQSATAQQPPIPCRPIVYAAAAIDDPISSDQAKERLVSKSHDSNGQTGSGSRFSGVQINGGQVNDGQASAGQNTGGQASGVYNTGGQISGVQDDSGQTGSTDIIDGVTLPLAVYDEVANHLKAYKRNVLGAGSLVPSVTLDVYRGKTSHLRSSPEDVEARYRSMPATLQSSLLPFQREGVRFGLERKGRVLIADEMGVGKTVQAMALAACYQDAWPLLVVAPASMRLVWAEELEKWMPHLRPSQIHVIEGKEQRLGSRAFEAAAAAHAAFQAKSHTEMEAQRVVANTAAAAAAKNARGRAIDCCGAESAGGALFGSAKTAAGASAGAGAGVGAAGHSSGGASPMTKEVISNPTVQAAIAAALPRIAITSYEMMRRLTCVGCCTGSQAGPDDAACNTPHAIAAGDKGAARVARRCTSPATCMASLPWGVVIVDESHNLRTTNSKQKDAPHTEACTAVASRARHAILLTGTPSLAKPYDLFRQVECLRSGLLGATKEDFAARYCDRRLVPQSMVSFADSRKRWDNSGGSRLSELHGLLVREVMVRRLKRDVLKELPPLRRQVVRLPHPGRSRVPGGGNASKAKGSRKCSRGAGIGKSSRDDRDEEGQEGLEGESENSEEEEDEQEEAEEERQALASMQLMWGAGEGCWDGLGQGKHEGGGHLNAQGLGAGVPTAAAVPAGAAGIVAGDASRLSSPMSVHRRTALAKMPDVLEWLTGKLVGSLPQANATHADKQGQEVPAKFLVFAHHIDVMDALAAELLSYRSTTAHVSKAEKRSGGVSKGMEVEEDEVDHGTPMGIPFVRIDGSHDSAQRREAVSRFRSDPSIRVALLSITAAAVGLDFSSASAVVFVELPHEVALVRQAEDRAHRKGATKAVNVYFLCAKGTCDDRRWQKLSSSLLNITAVHDGTSGPGHAGPPSDGAPAPPLRGLHVDEVVEMCGRGSGTADRPSGKAGTSPARQGVCLAIKDGGRSSPAKQTSGAMGLCVMSAKQKAGLPGLGGCSSTPSKLRSSRAGVITAGNDGEGSTSKSDGAAQAGGRLPAEQESSKTGPTKLAASRPGPHTAAGAAGESTDEMAAKHGGIAAVVRAEQTVSREGGRNVVMLEAQQTAGHPLEQQQQAEKQEPQQQKQQQQQQWTEKQQQQGNERQEGADGCRDTDLLQGRRNVPRSSMPPNGVCRCGSACPLQQAESERPSSPTARAGFGVIDLCTPSPTPSPQQLAREGFTGTPGGVFLVRASTETGAGAAPTPGATAASVGVLPRHAVDAPEAAAAAAAAASAAGKHTDGALPPHSASSPEAAAAAAAATSAAGKHTNGALPPHAAAAPEAAATTGTSSLLTHGVQAAAVAPITTAGAPLPDGDKPDAHTPPKAPSQHVPGTPATLQAAAEKFQPAKRAKCVQLLSLGPSNSQPPSPSPSPYPRLQPLAAPPNPQPQPPQLPLPFLKSLAQCRAPPAPRATSSDLPAHKHLPSTTPPPTHSTQASQPPPATAPSPPLSVWFEVSANTGRLHCHLAPHGGCLLGLNLPADLLCLPPQHHQPTLRALCGAYAQLLQEEQQQVQMQQQRGLVQLKQEQGVEEKHAVEEQRQRGALFLEGPTSLALAVAAEHALQAARLAKDGDLRGSALASARLAACTPGFMGPCGLVALTPIPVRVEAVEAEGKGGEAEAAGVVGAGGANGGAEGRGVNADAACLGTGAGDARRSAEGKGGEAEAAGVVGAGGANGGAEGKGAQLGADRGDVKASFVSKDAKDEEGPSAMAASAAHQELVDVGIEGLNGAAHGRAAETVKGGDQESMCVEEAPGRSPAGKMDRAVLAQAPEANIPTAAPPACTTHHPNNAQPGHNPQNSAPTAHADRIEQGQASQPGGDHNPQTPTATASAIYTTHKHTRRNPWSPAPTAHAGHSYQMRACQPAAPTTPQAVPPSVPTPHDKSREQHLHIQDDVVPATPSDIVLETPFDHHPHSYPPVYSDLDPFALPAANAPTPAFQPLHASSAETPTSLSTIHPPARPHQAHTPPLLPALTPLSNVPNTPAFLNANPTPSLPTFTNVNCVPSSPAHTCTHPMPPLPPLTHLSTVPNSHITDTNPTPPQPALTPPCTVPSPPVLDLANPTSSGPSGNADFGGLTPYHSNPAPPAPALMTPCTVPISPIFDPLSPVCPPPDIHCAQPGVRGDQHIERSSVQEGEGHQGRGPQQLLLQREEGQGWQASERQRVVGEERGSAPEKKKSAPGLAGQCIKQSPATDYPAQQPSPNQQTHLHTADQSVELLTSPTDIPVQAPLCDNQAQLQACKALTLTQPLVTPRALRLSVAQLEEVLQEAIRFANDWNELRAVTRSRLQNRVVSANLEDAVEVANAEATAAGAFGSSTTRYVQGGSVLPPPPGAEWRTVYVRVPARFGTGAKLLQPYPGSSMRSPVLVREYLQAFIFSTPPSTEATVGAAEAGPGCATAHSKGETVITSTKEGHLSVAAAGEGKAADADNEAIDLTGADASNDTAAVAAAPEEKMATDLLGAGAGQDGHAATAKGSNVTAVIDLTVVDDSKGGDEAGSKARGIRAGTDDEDEAGTAAEAQAGDAGVLGWLLEQQQEDNKVTKDTMPLSEGGKGAHILHTFDPDQAVMGDQKRAQQHQNVRPEGQVVGASAEATEVEVKQRLPHPAQQEHKVPGHHHHHQQQQQQQQQQQGHQQVGQAHHGGVQEPLHQERQQEVEQAQHGRAQLQGDQPQQEVEKAQHGGAWVQGDQAQQPLCLSQRSPRRQQQGLPGKAGPARPTVTQQAPLNQQLQVSAKRLCLHCTAHVVDAPSSPEALLSSTSQLFCKPACESTYYLKASSGAIRRALGKLENGVCCMCGVGCRTLVEQLQSIRHGSKAWKERRLALITQRFPKLVQRNYKGYLDRLIAQAVEGNAWHADHIVPVYQGGGLCELDNLRTLCVACHADVTKAQAQERAAERRRVTARMRDIRSFLTPSQPSPDAQLQQKRDHAPKPKQPKPLNQRRQPKQQSKQQSKQQQQQLKPPQQQQAQPQPTFVRPNIPWPAGLPKTLKVQCNNMHGVMLVTSVTSSIWRSNIVYNADFQLFRDGKESSDQLSGYAFEVESGRGSSKNWRTSIRVSEERVGTRLKHVGEWLDDHAKELVLICPKSEELRQLHLQQSLKAAPTERRGKRPSSGAEKQEEVPMSETPDLGEVEEEEGQLPEAMGTDTNKPEIGHLFEADVEAGLATEEVGAPKGSKRGRSGAAIAPGRAPPAEAATPKVPAKPAVLPNTKAAEAHAAHTETPGESTPPHTHTTTTDSEAAPSEGRSGRVFVLPAPPAFSVFGFAGIEDEGSSFAWGLGVEKGKEKAEGKVAVGAGGAQRKRPAQDQDPVQGVGSESEQAGSKDIVHEGGTSKQNSNRGLVQLEEGNERELASRGRGRGSPCACPGRGSRGGRGRGGKGRIQQVHGGDGGKGEVGVGEGRQSVKRRRKGCPEAEGEPAAKPDRALKSSNMVAEGEAPPSRKPAALSKAKPAPSREAAAEGGKPRTSKATTKPEEPRPASGAAPLSKKAETPGASNVPSEPDPAAACSRADQHHRPCFATRVNQHGRASAPPSCGVGSEGATSSADQGSHDFAAHAFRSTKASLEQCLPLEDAEVMKAKQASVVGLEQGHAEGREGHLEGNKGGRGTWETKEFGGRTKLTKDAGEGASHDSPVLQQAPLGDSEAQPGSATCSKTRAGRATLLPSPPARASASAAAAAAAAAPMLPANRDEQTGLASCDVSRPVSPAKAAGQTNQGRQQQSGGVGRKRAREQDHPQDSSNHPTKLPAVERLAKVTQAPLAVAPDSTEPTPPNVPSHHGSIVDGSPFNRAPLSNPRRASPSLATSAPLESNAHRPSPSPPAQPTTSAMSLTERIHCLLKKKPTSSGTAEAASKRMREFP